MMSFSREFVLTCAVSVLSLIVIIVAIVYLANIAKKRRENININIICNFSSKEADLIEKVMNKYRCTFPELILLGVFQFQDEGRNLFDVIDEKRDHINGVNRPDFTKNPVIDNKPKNDIFASDL